MAISERPTTGQDNVSILSLVKQVQYKAYVRLESAFQPLGVTAVQFRVLTTIGSHPDLCAADLARIYDVKPQSMIRQIAALEEGGLIERRTSSANKRLLELNLTPLGRQVLNQCHDTAQAVERDILLSLSEPERLELRRMLQTLQHALSASNHPGLEEISDEYRRPGVQRV